MSYRTPEELLAIAALVRRGWAKYEETSDDLKVKADKRLVDYAARRGIKTFVVLLEHVLKAEANARNKNVL